MPPAAKTPFVKGVLESPKLLIRGAHILRCMDTVFPIGADFLPEGLIEVFAPLFSKSAAAGGKKRIAIIHLNLVK
jgi:hypothetical protein